jgi:hypothetical protein
MLAKAAYPNLPLGIRDMLKAARAEQQKLRESNFYSSMHSSRLSNAE